MGKNMKAGLCKLKFCTEANQTLPFKRLKNNFFLSRPLLGANFQMGAQGQISLMKFLNGDRTIVEWLVHCNCNGGWVNCDQVLFHFAKSFLMASVLANFLHKFGLKEHDICNVFLERWSKKRI